MIEFQAFSLEKDDRQLNFYSTKIDQQTLLSW
jgi:hypothetical protein